MKNLDNYEVWEPVKDLSDDLYFGSLQHENGNLMILLKDLNSDSKLLKIEFDKVIGYRVFPEGSRLKTIHEVPSFGKYKTSTSSELLRWFDEESSGIFADWNLVHYLICNIDNVIDIVSGGTVKAEWNDHSGSVK